ncbi:MAG TPA: hypothetical protein VJ652_03145, partial [Noviherbaspirillum sp.]|nr:hypothetical protein [Noviherbaspirillum sp.]
SSRANASIWIARVCLSARREVGGDKGIRTNAVESGKNKAAFACRCRSFYDNSRSCGAAKTRKV